MKMTASTRLERKSSFVAPEQWYASLNKLCQMSCLSDVVGENRRLRSEPFGYECNGDSTTVIPCRQS